MNYKKPKCLYSERTTANGYQTVINDFDGRSFGYRLEHLRKEKKLSQKALAEDLSVSQVSISYWESGKVLPDLNTFWIICQYFEVEPGYLMGSYENISASTGLSEDSLKVLNQWQSPPPPLRLVSSESLSETGKFEDVNVNRKKPCLRAEVLNDLCFKNPDIFGKILDKLAVFIYSANTIKLETIVDDPKKKLFDVDTINKLTQLEIMELLRDLKDAATPKKAKKIRKDK